MIAVSPSVGVQAGGFPVALKTSRNCFIVCPAGNASSVMACTSRPTLTRLKTVRPALMVAGRVNE
jgi:hypothetical protein